MADPLDHNQVEAKEISTLLDVEKLDVDLYRSRNLFKPYFSRGAFGGQVISQCLVAATDSVKPEFVLHVSVFCTPHVLLLCIHVLTTSRLAGTKSLHVRFPSAWRIWRRTNFSDSASRPILFLAHLSPRRCFTTLIDYARDARTLRVAFAPSRAGRSSLS
jgi:hypothetical protein